MSTPKELFDARLHRALESAPDAHMRPDIALRTAVLKAAHEAVRADASPAAASSPWWTRWRAAPGARMPWNAAFATVLVAGFVTLLWQGQDVPDARRDSEAPVAAAAPEVPAAKPAAAPAPAPLAAETAASPARAAPRQEPAARDGERDRSHARERELREDRVSRKAAATKSERADAPVASMAQEQQGPAPTANVAPAPGGAAPAQAPAPALADAAKAQSTPAPAPAAAPPPAAASEMRARALAAPAAPSVAGASGGLGSLARRDAAAVLPSWTALRVPEGASPRAVTRADAGELPALLQTLTAPGSLAAPPSPATPALRIELLQGADPIGVLEIAEGRWRFTPVNGAAASTGRADAQAASGVRAELRRLGLLP